VTQVSALSFPRAEMSAASFLPLLARLIRMARGRVSATLYDSSSEVSLLPTRRSNPGLPSFHLRRITMLPLFLRLLCHTALLRRPPLSPIAFSVCKAVGVLYVFPHPVGVVLEEWLLAASEAFLFWSNS